MMIETKSSDPINASAPPASAPPIARPTGNRIRPGTMTASHGSLNAPMTSDRCNSCRRIGSNINRVVSDPVPRLERTIGAISTTTVPIASPIRITRYGKLLRIKTSPASAMR